MIECTVFTNNAELRGQDANLLPVITAACDIIMITGWFLAKLFFYDKGTYSVNKHKISSQGNFSFNPVGAYFFICSTGVASILLVAFFYCLSELCLQPQQRWLVRLAATIGSGGLMLVACFPERISASVQQVHDVGSTMAFGGLAAAAILCMAFITWENSQSSWRVQLNIGIVWLIILKFVFLLPFATESVRQWLGFLTIFVWINAATLLADRLDRSGKGMFSRSLG